MGFPTANIAIPPNGGRNGVWAGTVHLDSPDHRALHVAAISIGDRPTYYSRGQSLLEANLLDFTGDLYGQTVVVTLRLLIRPQRKFSGTSELVDQIQDDVARVRSWALQAGFGGCLRARTGTQPLAFESTGNRAPHCPRAQAPGPRRFAVGIPAAERLGGIAVPQWRRYRRLCAGFADCAFLPTMNIVVRGNRATAGRSFASYLLTG